MVGIRLAVAAAALCAAIGGAAAASPGVSGPAPKSPPTMELASLHLPARLRPSFAALETWPLPAEPLAGRTLSVSAADQIALAPREVILTFDDGPTARYTPKILKVLDAFGVKATFMMVGRMAEAHPLSAQAVALDGQTVGTHTYDHPDLARLDPGAALAEVTRGQAAVAAALAPVSARPSPFFRFPYLASTWFLQATLTMDGTIPLGVEIDSDDYFRDSPRQTLARLLARLEKAGRGIVLFHDIHPKTVVVLPLFLEALADRGYHVVQLVDDQPNPFNQPLLTAGN